MTELSSGRNVAVTRGGYLRHLIVSKAPAHGVVLGQVQQPKRGKESDMTINFGFLLAIALGVASLFLFFGGVGV